MRSKLICASAEQTNGDEGRSLDIKVKKKICFMAAALLVASLLSACGKDPTYLSGIKASDYVTLGEYKGIAVNDESLNMVGEFVDYYIDTYILQPMSTIQPVTDRTVVENGDTVNIDYTGYQDGEAFGGGTAQGDELTIGSGRFIPGFEEGLIGANVGETVTLDLSFPDDYWDEGMAGASVQFDVTVNSISVTTVPELTDELVQGLNVGGCSTAQEYWDYLYETRYSSTLRDDVIQAVMANCTFKEPPEKMVDRYYKLLLNSMVVEAAARDMDLNTYMRNYYNMDVSSYQQMLREDAVTTARQYIMLQAIADAEGITLSEEEIAQAAEENAATYNYESVEAFREDNDEEMFEEYLMADKVILFLIDNARINE